MTEQSTNEVIYDHPLYYDILFSWDRGAEAHFYARVFELSGVRREEAVLEVACGTGQIALQLARLGHTVTGMDISDRMLDFLASEANRQLLSVTTLCADMTRFSADRVYGAGYNPMSSFRMLFSDAEAQAHLRAVSQSLRSGGVYVLDMTFSEALADDPVTTGEDWEMSRDGVTVRATDDLIEVDDHGTRLELQWGAEAHLRNYTCASFYDLLDEVPTLVVESWHPETGREGEEGVSVFDAGRPERTGSPGRTMVVLRKR